MCNCCWSIYVHPFIHSFINRKKTVSIQFEPFVSPLPPFYIQLLQYIHPYFATTITVAAIVKNFFSIHCNHTHTPIIIIIQKTQNKRKKFFVNTHLMNNHTHTHIHGGKKFIQIETNLFLDQFIFIRCIFFFCLHLVSHSFVFTTPTQRPPYIYIFFFVFRLFICLFVYFMCLSVCFFFILHCHRWLSVHFFSLCI